MLFLAGSDPASRDHSDHVCLTSMIINMPNLVTIY